MQDENSGGRSLKESMITSLKEKNIKYFCVAGDLTSEGSPQEFKYCEEMLLDIANSLKLTKANYYWTGEA